MIPEQQQHTEEWRPAPGWWTWYEVSSLGRVRNVDTGLVLKPQVTDKGYERVALCWMDDKEFHRIHRLVARAFHGEPSEGMQVNHKNGVKNDNRAENLEWVTPAENAAHASAMGLNVGRIGERHFRSKLTEQRVKAARALRAKGYTFRRLARRFGVNHKTLRNAIVGRTWSHVK